MEVGLRVARGRRRSWETPVTEIAAEQRAATAPARTARAAPASSPRTRLRRSLTALSEWPVIRPGLACQMCDIWNWSRQMSSVQIEQKSYEMLPARGDQHRAVLSPSPTSSDRLATTKRSFFGARILSLGDGNAPGYLQLANIWMILNVGGGPTAEEADRERSASPTRITSTALLNFRVADIQACYELWTSRGAEFLTEPMPKYGEIRCYIRDPDGYIIEVGQSTVMEHVSRRQVNARPAQGIYRPGKGNGRRAAKAFRRTARL